MRALFIVAAIALGGCTKGSPTFGVLDSSAVPQLTFQGQTERVLAVGALNVTTQVTGECDPKVRGITVTAPGLAGALDVVSTGTWTIACAADGTFAFTMKSLNDLFGAAVANQTYRLEFRAETAGGMSTPSRLLVSYHREFPERWRLTSGGGESGPAPRAVSSTHFRADVRLTNRASDAAATSASFRMLSGRREQARP